MAASLTLLAVQVALLICGGSGLLSPVSAYYLGPIAFCLFMEIGRRKLYPFNEDGTVTLALKLVIVALLNGALAMSGANTLMRKKVILFWYPTEHSIWAAAPFLAIALVGAAFGLKLGRLRYGTDRED